MDFRNRFANTKDANSARVVREEARRRGLCINCFEGGHFARDCPLPRAYLPYGPNYGANVVQLDPGYSDESESSMEHVSEWEEDPLSGVCPK
jgi:hypothetical protein